MGKSVPSNKLNYKDMAKYVNRFHTFGFRIKDIKHFKPGQKGAITRKYNLLKLKQKVDKLAFKKANKKQIAKARKAGKVITNKGIFISVQKDATGKKIKGSRVTIKKSGVIRIKNKQRIEFEFTFDERMQKQFIMSPNEATTKNILDAVIKTDPDAYKLWKNKRAKRSMFLVFGRWPSNQPHIFISPQDMADSMFVYVSELLSDKAKAKITGFKIVFHVKPKRKIRTAAKESKVSRKDAKNAAITVRKKHAKRRKKNIR